MTRSMPLPSLADLSAEAQSGVVVVLKAALAPRVETQKSHLESLRAVAKTAGEGEVAWRESCWPAIETPEAPALGACVS